MDPKVTEVVGAVWSGAVAGVKWCFLIGVASIGLHFLFHWFLPAWMQAA